MYLYLRERLKFFFLSTIVCVYWNIQTDKYNTEVQKWVKT